MTAPTQPPMRVRDIFDDALTRISAHLVALLADHHQAGRLSNEQLAEAQAMVRERIASARADMVHALGEQIP